MRINGRSLVIAALVIVFLSAHAPTMLAAQAKPPGPIAGSAYSPAPAGSFPAVAAFLVPQTAKATHEKDEN